MLKVFNFDECQPNLSRKTSESLALTNMTDIDFIQCYNIIQVSSSKKECRICLQSNQDSQHVFSSPCKCTGTVQFVHETCFVTWIQRQYSLKPLKEQRKIREEGIQCELCKQKVHLIFQIQSRCLDCAQSSAKIKNNLRLFVIIIILMILALVSLSFLIYFMQAQSVSSFGVEKIATAVLICGLLFLLVAFISVLYSLVTNFLVQKKLRLKSFRSSKIMKAKNRKQVIPF